MIIEDSQDWLPEGAEVITEAEEITTDTWLPEGAILESTEVEEDIEVEEEVVEEEPLEDKRKKRFRKNQFEVKPIEVSTTETEVDDIKVDEVDIEETDPPRYSYAGKEYDEEGLKKLAADSNITVDELLKKTDDDNNLLVTEIQEGYTGAQSVEIQNEKRTKTLEFAGDYDISHIPIDKASSNLQNELFDLTLETGLDISQDQIIGYSIEDSPLEIKVDATYQDGVASSPSTGGFLLTGQDEVLVGRTAQKAIIYYKELDEKGNLTGDVKKLELATPSLENQESYTEINFQEDWPDLLSPGGDVENIDYINSQIRILKENLGELDPKSQDALQIENRIALFERKKTENLIAFTEMDLNSTAALFNDGIFQAENDQFLEDGKSGSFNVANAILPAIENVGKNIGEIVNPASKGQGMSIEEQAENNFNNSTWRALGFYMIDGKVYSGVKFGDYGPAGGREQFWKTGQEKFDETWQSGAVVDFRDLFDEDQEGVNYIDLDFGEEGDNKQNAEKLAKFLKENYKEGLQENSETGKLEFGSENKQILLKNLDDFLNDKRRAAYTITADYNKAAVKIESEYSLLNILEDGKIKIGEINKFVNPLKNQAAEIMMLQDKLNLTDDDIEKINAMPEGPERNIAIEKYKKNLKKYERKNKKFKYNQLITDQNTPLGKLVYKKKTRKRSFKSEEALVAKFEFPSGITIDVDYEDLRGYGIKASDIGGTDEENKLRFAHNIKKLGLTEENIDYIENMSAAEEWAMLKTHGFHAEQIIELQELNIQDQAIVAIDALENLEYIQRLYVDKIVATKKAHALVVRKQNLVQELDKLEAQGYGMTIKHKEEQARKMRIGELVSWSGNRFSENAVGTLAGGLDLFLRAAQAINQSLGGDELDNQAMENALHNMHRSQKAAETYIKGDHNTAVNKQFEKSYAGQILGTFYDMVFDVAILTATGGGSFIAVGGKRLLLSSAKATLKKEGFKAAVNKIVKGAFNPMRHPMFLKQFNDITDDFLNIPEFAHTIYAKDENGDFKLDASGEKIVISEPPSAQAKMGYTFAVSYIIGALDKAGLNTQTKAVSNLAKGIANSVLKKAKLGDPLKKIARQEIKKLLASGLITIGRGAGGEVLTEELQSLFEWGAQDVFNAMHEYGGDYAGFVNPDWGSKEMFKQMWDIAVVSAFASGPISIQNAVRETVTGINGVVQLRKIAETSDNAFDLISNQYTPDMMNLRREHLNEKVENPDNDFIQADANEEIKFHEEVAEIIQQIPSDLRVDLKRKAFDYISAIEDIKAEIYKKDDQGNLTSTLAINPQLANTKLDLITELETKLGELSTEVLVEGEFGKDAEVKEKYINKESTQKDYDNIVAMAGDDTKFYMPTTIKEAKKLAEEHNITLDDNTNAAISADGKHIIINPTAALTQEGRQAAKHEFFHKFLSGTLNKKGNENLALALGNAVDEELSKLDPKTIKNSEFKKRLELYIKEPANILAEEKLTLLSDALSTGDIKLKENIVTKFQDFFRRLFQSIGLKDIELTGDSKQVINLIKDYNKSVGKGRFTKAQKKFMKGDVKVDESLILEGEATAVAEAEADAKVDTKVKKDEDTKKDKKSKTKVFDNKKIEEIDTQIKEAINKKKEQVNKQKKLVTTGQDDYQFEQKQKDNVDKIKQTNKDIQNLEDIKVIREGKKNTQRQENRITENTKDIRAKIATSITNNPKYFAGIAPEAVTQGMGISKYSDAKKAYKESLENNLAVMIKNEWDPTIEPDLEKFVRNRGFVRAKSLATELGVVDTRKIKGGIGITKDISTMLDLSTDEDIEADIDKVEKEKAYLVKDKLPGAKAVYDKMKGLTKDVDVDSKTYKQTPKVALDETVGMFMTDPDAVYQSGKVKGQNIKESIVNKIKNNANLNKQDIAALKSYLETEITVDGETVLVADILQESLPDGTTPSGTATGVQNVLLKSPLYKKGSRVKTKKTGSKAGLPIQVKQKMPTKKFIDLFNDGELMKALIVQTDRILTNQAARDTQKKPAAKIGEGRSETMYSKSDILTIFDKNKLNILSQQRDINAAIKKIGIDGKVTINKSNRKAKQKEVLDAIEAYGLTPNVLTTAMMASGGAIREARMEIDPKTNDAVKVYYYQLTNGDWIKARKSETSGRFILQPKAPKGLALETKGSKLYFGKSDPAYIKALKAAEKNLKDGKKENEFKRIHVPKDNKPIDKEFIIKNKAQSDINMGILEDVVSQLTDAVHPESGKGMPIEIAALFIVQGYQATGGLIKAAAPFKYVSRNFDWSTDPRAKQDDTEKSASKNKYREEHNPPASVIGAELIWAIANNKAKAIMPDIKKNFTQTQLSKADDTKIDIAGLASTLPEGTSIINNPVIRDIEAGLNLNNIINPLTGKTKAEENGVGVDPKYYNDPDVSALQNEILKQKLNGEPVNVQKKLKAYLPLAPKKNKARIKMTNEISGSEVKSGSKYSKNNSNEVIRELGILDKALQISRDPNAPVKKIRAFDFDDTVARTKSKVLYTMPDGKQGSLTAEQFAAQGTEMEANGAEFDFSEFNKVVDGKKGPLFEVMKKMQDAAGDRDMFILTARSPGAATAIQRFLKELGVDIPVENITGLGDSSPLAKSGWIVDKAAEGYNDFYFADDHTANVDAVKKVLDVIDVKSKVQQAKAKFSKSASNIFNDIIENKTGIESQKVFSDAKAKVRGKGKGKFRFFIPPSAEDFEGLLYKTLGKGKLGNDQKAWYKEVLFDPFARGMNDMATDEKNLMSDFNALKKALKKSGIPKNLNKKAVDKFTYSDVARVLAWDKQGIEIDGLSKTDLAKIKKFAEQNPGIDIFSQQLIDINKESGYKYPGADWLVGTVATDLRDGLNTTKREDYLKEWQDNVDKIFTPENLNKLEAVYGSKYREALENSLFRMKTGRNRIGKGSRIENQLLDYLNNSVGAVMFLNMRSAALQTISAINFANWGFNNPVKMTKAFANQPQYWKDFMKLMNSDFLVTRRSGLKINVSESEIANAASIGSNKVKGVLNALLKKGFLPTQIADSFAIATGGATFYRNRINDLIKNEGMSKVDAETQAYQEFREIAETSQQSSRPDKISQQQASGIGRVILAFANTPSQYARIIKKSTLDLVNNRGDWRHNMSKILYYGFAQNLIFNALQQAIFAWGWDDDEEEEEKDYDKEFRIANGMMDSILRGLGWGGALVSALKNVGIDAYDKLSEEDPGFRGMELDESGLPILDFSPPVDVKVSKLMRAGSNWEYNSWKPEARNPFDINNPAYKSIALTVAATTNVPLDRLYQKYENLKAVFAQDQENWKRVALLFGYPEWQLESSKERSKRKEEEKEQKRNLKAQDKLELYTKVEQEDILKQYGLSQEKIDALKNESQRVEAIEKLKKKKKIQHVPSDKVKIAIKKKKEVAEEKKIKEKEEESKSFKTPVKSFDKSKNKEQDVKVRIVAEDRSNQQTRLYKLKKQSQIDTLINLGVPKNEIPNYEGGRVALIERLYKEKKEKETVGN